MRRLDELHLDYPFPGGNLNSREPRQKLGKFTAAVN
jgi:hypothetical protein